MLDPQPPAFTSSATASRALNSQDLRAANEQEYVPEILPCKNQGVMVPRTQNIIIGMSTGALFDLRTDHEIEQQHGAKAYSDYQIAHENEILNKGQGFSVADKCFKINEKLAAIGSELKFDVLVTSKNTPSSSVRIYDSAKHHGLPLRRGIFAGGEPPYGYAQNMGADLYLTLNKDDARASISAGLAAAQLVPSCMGNEHPEQLRIAFDADAVLFTDESEQISKRDGLEAFYKNEEDKADIPINTGPLYKLLHRLSEIKNLFPLTEQPIRIAVTTARAAPAHKRLVKTLREWGIDVDELHLLGGMSKGQVLKQFKPDIFFDDNEGNVLSGAEHVNSAHVIYGINNQSI